ncbi:glycosyltransferase [Tropicibacter sp. S64]|uniref:glycosyltransferase n=1 Tax=Tropicibacter sp. S64 TaxID=3415122 RepID=UPI003C7A4958
MADTPVPSPPSWQRFTDAADHALDHGDIAEARAQYEAALAEVIPAKFWLLDAELTRREGNHARALHLLSLAEAAHPHNFWPPLKRAELLHDIGRDAEAAEALDAVFARGGVSGFPRFLTLDLALRQSLAQPARLARALGAAVDALPDLDPTEPLAALRALPGGPGLAAPIYHRLLERDPENVGLRVDYAALLTGPCPPEAAVRGLSLLLGNAETEDAPGALPLEFAVPLARAHRQLGQLAQEEAILTRILTHTPTAPVVLRYLYSSQMASADADILDEIGAALQPHLTERLHNELSAQAALALMDWDRAVALLRPRRQRPKAAHEAQMLATALIGQGRYALALRYLGLAVRRWPEARGLATFRILWALKLGRLDLAEAAIDAGAGHLPEGELTTHRLMLAGMRNDLGTAMRHYARLRDLGQLNKQTRTTMAKLVYSLADIRHLDAIRDQIGDPLGEAGGLLHRSGLAGTMALELQLEERDYKARGGYDKVEDWRHTRPESVIAALRLIDHWRSTAPGWTTGPEIPKRIVQYWDKPEPPDAVRDMVQSWAAAPGYTHDLWDRPGAVRFLRDHFGPRWVRALDLARNPAEESDLLRLCLLVHHGGIWADADDRLYGDLDGLLQGTAGLVVYREALGGALGNNFIAAPPQHPALIAAAKLVRKALLERNAESAWGKTGPGVLTRTVAHYLVQTEIPRDDFPLTILDTAPLAQVVAMHNPVRYKTLPSHWAANGTRQRPSQVWPTLLEALRGRETA